MPDSTEKEKKLVCDHVSSLVLIKYGQRMTEAAFKYLIFHGQQLMSYLSVNI